MYGKNGDGDDGRASEVVPYYCCFSLYITTILGVIGFHTTWEC